MKICFVVHDLSKTKGHDRYTVELIENLCTKHRIYVFASSIKDVDRKNFIFYKIPTIKFPALLKICMFIIICSPIIWLVHRKEKFDVIHYQGACALPIRPAVITAHVCSAEYLKIYRSLKNSIKITRRAYYYLYTYINMFLEKIFFNRPSVLKIISPSG